MFQRLDKRRFAWLIAVAGLLLPATAFGTLSEDSTVQDPEATDAPKPAADSSPSSPAGFTDAEFDKLKHFLDDQRKTLLSNLHAPDKASQVVTCAYKESSGLTTGSQPNLECGESLLVGGENISSVQVSGLPKNKWLTVSIVAADFWGGQKHKKYYKDKKDSQTWYDSCRLSLVPLSSDSLTFQDGRDSALIQIHKDRYFKPTYGGWHSSTIRACENLRGENPKERDSLSIVLSSAPLLALVKVQFEDSTGVHTATGPLFLLYQRWAVETGGFIALTNLGDKTLKTTTNKDGKVHVDRIEDSQGLNQQSGVMLSVIPRNYEFLGLGLGLVTNSDRAQDIYLGFNLRARAFGDSGLASVFMGAVNRNIRNFRDVVGKDFEADSESLKGAVESKIGYAIGFSFGFKFGGVDATNDPSAAKK